METLAQHEIQKSESPDGKDISISFRCSKDVRRALKMRAAEDDTTVDALVREVVLRYLQEQKAAAA